MPSIDKGKVKKHFSSHASEYDQHADLQKEMARELLAQIENCQPKSILDIGTGTGELALELTKTFPAAQITAIDIAEGMIQYAKSKLNGHRINFEIADAETLPYPDACFDLITSNASLQWMDPILSLENSARVLKSGGKLFFSTFGPGTLNELKELGLQTHDFTSKAMLEQALSNAFARHQITTRKKVRNYPSAKDLFAFLKKTGASCALGGISLGLSGKRKFTAFNYAPISVSYEIILGCAVK